MKKAVIALALLLLLGPFMGLLGIGVLMNPSANAECTIDGSGITVGNIPDSLTATTANGETITLNRQQLTHAATIIEIGSGIDGVGRDGIQIALMAALTESSLRMLSNTSAYPESADYPNDGNGSDHDSLGLFQMRPQSGWGTVADLMDSTYQARAFYGGPDGPNYPSPRGLLDIPGWQQMGKGEAAQAVEVSAHPDRYNNYEPVAATILSALTGSGGPTTATGPYLVTTRQVTESSRVVFPLPEGTWVITSEFGYRSDPFTGETSYHSGLDLGAADGTPILAAAAGAAVERHELAEGVVVADHQLDAADALGGEVGDDGRGDQPY